MLLFFLILCCIPSFAALERSSRNNNNRDCRCSDPIQNITIQPGKTLQKVFTNSYAICCFHCEQNLKCKAFTIWEAAKMCYLKADDCNWGIGVGVVSGIVECVPSSDKNPAANAKQPCTADIAFLVDHSNSVGAKNFRIIMDFLSEVTKAFDVDSSHIQIALVPYSKKVYDSSILHFDQLSTNEKVKEKFEGAQLMGGSQAGTGTALSELELKVFQKKHGARGHANKVAIVVTNGIATGQKTGSAARRLAEDGFTLIAIGIGPRVNNDGLLDITGTRNPGNIFLVHQFKDLMSKQKNVAQKILNVVCDRQ